MQSLKEAYNPHVGAPEIVVSCIEFLRSYGMDREGIFRVAPDQIMYNSAQTRMRKDSLRQKEDPSVRSSFVIGDTGGESTSENSSMDDDRMVLKDIDEIAAVLKIFLLDLDEPLITFTAFEKIKTATISLENHQINRSRWRVTVNNALQNMPEHHRNTLFYLLDFLEDVAANEEVNKMSISNLATVFGPAVMRSKCEPKDVSEMMLELRSIQAALALMIEEFANTTDEAPIVPAAPGANPKEIEPSRELSEPVNSENDVTSGSLALKANEETLKQEIVPVCYYLKLFESLWVRTTRRPPQLLP